MKYTSYFSRLLKSQGIPHLSADAFALYMNIVHLEGRIAQLEELSRQTKNEDTKFALKLQKGLLEEKIMKLTNHREPEAFVQDLLLR
jgi:hypothetical protein